jgi:hypothetical protein
MLDVQQLVITNVCVSVCVCARARESLYTYIPAPVGSFPIHAYIHAYIHTIRKHTHAQNMHIPAPAGSLPIHTCTNTYIHTYMYIHTHKQHNIYIYIYIIRIHKYVHIHACIYLYIHVHTCTSGVITHGLRHTIFPNNNVPSESVRLRKNLKSQHSKKKSCYMEYFWEFVPWHPPPHTKKKASIWITFENLCLCFTTPHCFHPCVCVCVCLCTYYIYTNTHAHTIYIYIYVYIISAYTHI